VSTMQGEEPARVQEAVLPVEPGVEDEDSGDGLRDDAGRPARLGQEILSSSGTPRHLPQVKGDASLEQSRQERDRAWDDLRALLAAETRRTSPVPDPLDAGRPLAQAGQVSPLAAINQLRIAECYQELAAGARPEPGDLGAGNATIAQLDPALLPETERPRYHYLHTWFLAERARAATGNERERLVTEAVKQQTLLALRYPDSELTKAAKILLLDLNTTTVSAPTPVPASGGEKR
jgi:hypothetical protein